MDSIDSLSSWDNVIDEEIVRECKRSSEQSVNDQPLDDIYYSLEYDAEDSAKIQQESLREQEKDRIRILREQEEARRKKIVEESQKRAATINKQIESIKQLMKRKQKLIDQIGEIKQLASRKRDEQDHIQKFRAWKNMREEQIREEEERKERARKEEEAKKKKARQPAVNRVFRSLLTNVKTSTKKWVGCKYEGQEEFCDALDDVLTALKDYSEHSYPFLTKVKASDAPNYSDIIKKPMDLGLMAKKLKKLEYANKYEFQLDLLLIFNNCRMYNTDPSSKMYVDHANKMESKAKELMKNVKDVDFSTRERESVSPKTSPPNNNTPAPPVKEEERTTSPPKTTTRSNKKGTKVTPNTISPPYTPTPTTYSPPTTPASPFQSGAHSPLPSSNSAGHSSPNEESMDGDDHQTSTTCTTNNQDEIMFDDEMEEPEEKIQESEESIIKRLEEVEKQLDSLNGENEGGDFEEQIRECEERLSPEIQMDQSEIVIDEHDIPDLIFEEEKSTKIATWCRLTQQVRSKRLKHIVQQSQLPFSNQDAFIRSPEMMKTYLDNNNQSPSLETIVKRNQFNNNNNNNNIKYLTKLQTYDQELINLNIGFFPEYSHMSNSIPRIYPNQPIPCTNSSHKKIINQNQQNQQNQQSSLSSKGANELLLNSVVKILNGRGFSGSSQETLNVMVDVVSGFITNIGRNMNAHCSNYPSQVGSTKRNTFLQLCSTFGEMGISNIYSLKEFQQQQQENHIDQSDDDQDIQDLKSTSLFYGNDLNVDGQSIQLPPPIVKDKEMFYDYQFFVPKPPKQESTLKPISSYQPTQNKPQIIQFHQNQLHQQQHNLHQQQLQQQQQQQQLQQQQQQQQHNLQIQQQQQHNLQNNQQQIHINQVQTVNVPVKEKERVKKKKSSEKDKPTKPKKKAKVSSTSTPSGNETKLSTNITNNTSTTTTTTTTLNNQISTTLIPQQNTPLIITQPIKVQPIINNLPAPPLLATPSPQSPMSIDLDKPLLPSEAKEKKKRGRPHKKP